MTRLTPMREKLSNSGNNGSITVYLTLMLLIMLSFVFTALEAARITSAKAYHVMVSEMASESLKGSYFFPLFEEYGLFAIDGGYGGTNTDIAKMTDFLTDKLEYSTFWTWRGLITAEHPRTIINSTETLLTSNTAGFASQIRDEVGFEGAELILSEFTDNAVVQNSETLDSLLEAQEAAMNASEEVSQQILKLMSCVDGVATTKTGLKVKKGQLVSSEEFLKCFGAGDMSYMKSTYGNPRIFNLASSYIVYPGEVGKRVVGDIEKCIEIQTNISVYEKETESLELKLRTLKNDEERDRELIKDVEEQIDSMDHLIKEYNKELKNLMDRIEEGYGMLDDTIKASKASVNEAMDAVNELAISQKGAASSILGYDNLVNSSAGLLTDGMQSYFEGEAKELKALIGYEGTGYDTGTMIQTLKSNKQFLENCSLPRFDKNNLPLMKECVQKVVNAAAHITYNGFYFDYGSIHTGEITGIDILERIEELLGGGVLKAIGIEEISERELSGTDLPSALGASISSGGLVDSMITELYLKNNFGCYTKQKDFTKLAYEREYIAFGRKNDKLNLEAMASKLYAFRFAMSLAAVLTDETRTNEAEALGRLIAGFTGLPPLIYVIKYLILTLWATAEALVEVCALFNGKAVPVFSEEGHVNFAELLLMSRPEIQNVASEFEDSGAPDYSLYLTFFSMFEDVNTRNLRALDLIQENIRYRFRDSFRIGNCITEVDFTMSVDFIQKFDTGFFNDEAYGLKYRTKMIYAEDS